MLKIFLPLIKSFKNIFLKDLNFFILFLIYFYFFYIDLKKNIFSKKKVSLSKLLYRIQNMLMEMVKVYDAHKLTFSVILILLSQNSHHLLLARFRARILLLYNILFSNFIQHFLIKWKSKKYIMIVFTPKIQPIKKLLKSIIYNNNYCVRFNI